MDLKIHVLFRYSKKTGKVDMTMTELGNAMMRMWALTNTPPSKNVIIAERDTGKVVCLAEGTKDGFPNVKMVEKEDLGTIDEYGVPLSVLQSIRDDRFDKDPDKEKPKKKKPKQAR